MKMKSMIIGVSLSLLASPVFAVGDFSTLNGIPAEMMSNTDMEKVEGKMFQNYYGGILAGLYYRSPGTFPLAYQIGMQNAFNWNNRLYDLRVNGGSSLDYLSGLNQLVQWARSPF